MNVLEEQDTTRDVHHRDIGDLSNDLRAAHFYMTYADDDDVRTEVRRGRSTVRCRQQVAHRAVH